MGLHDREKSIV